MIPRIEQKLLLNSAEHLIILEWLKVNNAKYLSLCNDLVSFQSSIISTKGRIINLFKTSKILLTDLAPEL